MLKRFIGFVGHKGFSAACGALLMAHVLPAVAQTGVPPIVASSVTQYAYQNGTAFAKVVMDSNGNLFVQDQEQGVLWGIPAGSTTPIKLISGMSYQQGLAVDQYNDLIVAGDYTGSHGDVYFVTATQLATALAGGSLGSTVNLANYAGGYIALTGGYAPIEDVAVDKNNVVYLGVRGGACSCGYNAIFSIQTQGPNTTQTTIAAAGTAKLVVANIPNGVSGMAVDTSNHLFFADGSNVYEILLTAATKTPVKIGINYSSSTPLGFKAPSGVTVDASGNLFVSDGGSSSATNLLFEIPNENGTLNSADQFIVGGSTALTYGVAFDRFGNFYAGTPNYYSNQLNKVTVGALNMGTIPVTTPGTTSAYLNLTLEFNANVTMSSIAPYQGHGAATEFFQNSYTTCKIGSQSNAGSSCSLQYTFTPSSTGYRKGSVVITGSNNKPIATAFLAGIGSGAALTLDPGTQAVVTGSTAWKTPSAVALDGQSNVYVADSTANTVQVISLSNNAPIASIGTGLNKPGGVAVDGAGNVLIADTGNNRIVEVPNENGTLVPADQITVLSYYHVIPVTGFSIAAGQVTFQANNALSAGQVVTISGLTSTAGAMLDGQSFTVLATGLSSTQFIASTTLANVAQTADVGTATPVVAGVAAPNGIFIGPFGGVYVADTGNKRVVRLSTYEGYGLVGLTTVGSGFTTPQGVATDSAGNVYVTDSGANAIFEVNQTTGAVTTALANLNAPTAIAFDIGNSAYFVNSGTNSVIRVPNVNGALNANTELALGSLSLLNTPSGVVVNGSGNVVISDSGVPNVFTLVRTTGSLAFGSVDTSQSSISQTLTLTSAGTASLTLGAIPYVATNTTSFAVSSATSSAGCTASSTLTVGSSCGYAAVFSPTVTGPLTDTLTFSTNAVNASSLTANLTGTGTALPQSTTTLSISPAAPTYGQQVIVTATVTPGATSTAAPTGTVTFYVNGIAQVPSTLSKNAQGLYTATFTFPPLALTASTNSMGANYNGDANNSSSHAVPYSLVIAREPNTTTETVYPVVAQPVNSQFTFTGVVTPSALGTPTGSMILVVAGTTTAVAGPITVNALSSTGASVYGATIPYTPPGGNGDYQYQIIYSGDVNFLPSTSGNITASYRPVGYTITLPSASFTVTDGQSIQIPVTLTSISGYSGTITVGAVNVTTLAQTAPCTGLPSYVTCTFVPGYVTLNGSSYQKNGNPTAVIMMTLTTSVPPPTAAGGSILWPGALAGILALALAVGKRRSLMRTRLMSVLLLVVLGSVGLGVTGCGNGGSSAYATAKGTSSITLTCSGTPIGGYPTAPPPFVPNIVNTSTFSLTVQ